ncbi:aspartyl/asparaginyl beta-hydroxylase domain-containing protein [Sphingosinicella humi]|uniref:Hydroxylase n=1 Tax=Allosphingosinicella humi TaxID=2068657 RepID=A0A2U2J245_9SPHN|nr:aspartyl/asparaginyl beta-hydroxylase domain-containing protein [Sphingosinicella humi]PWG02396.1 hydroxylase [Sphingosinicella humi]
MVGGDTQLSPLEQAGFEALRRGDVAGARAALERFTGTGNAPPRAWMLFARTCEMQGDAAAAERALDQVLAADPRNLRANLMKGDLLTRSGEDRAAVSWYKRALSLAQGAGPLPNDLVDGLRRAEAATRAATGRFQDHLTGRLASAGIDLSQSYGRFAESIDILTGAKAPQLQQPTSFYYPRLPQIAFYEAEDFPWLDDMLAALPDMRAEAEAVLAGHGGVAPYVQRAKDRPETTHKLLDDPSWSAFHLWRDGEPIAENAARCPATMKALEAAPMPRINERWPIALFSILRPGTHIEPHCGMVNTRLICHIPLIVPEGCRLRVGNETRVVEEGKPLLFDDSIEHEAWNDGDAIRAILLFEVWRPELTEEERHALTVMFEAISDYSRPPETPPTAA